LSEMLRRRDAFFATLLHELRNPLAPMTNALQSLAMDATDRSRVDAMRGIIARQLHQLTRLVDDLLDVSRIALGNIKLQLRAINLAEVMAGAVEAVRPVIEQRRHELTVATSPGTIMLEADSVRLTQVLTNLLVNAAKYTHPGGHIRLSMQLTGNFVAIHVCDDGVGIPAEKLSEVFELFARAAPESSGGDSGGLGVGLAVSRQLVELHGGSIRAHSAGPGRGSEFIVSLPLHAARQPDAAVTCMSSASLRSSSAS
jgi:signal transduction histidine kinase